jgi:CNT family concentrative nucleoside transporter
VIRPYIANLTPSQLFLMMTVGMAGVAGTILAAYASMGIRIDYLVAAAFMSAPGGILMAKLIMPDTVPLVVPATDPATRTAIEAEVNEGGHVTDSMLANPHDPADLGPLEVEASDPEEERPANIIMAASQGAQTGVKLAVAVGAMVLAFVALVALANGILGGIGGWFGYPELSFQAIVGYAFAPIMWLLGAGSWAEALHAGSLFGTKLVLNEFVAFIDLGKDTVLSPHMVAVVTFALCGFANFSSIAIQMAVTGGLAPNQRPLIAKLGLRALAAGSLANLMSAALAGLFL